MRRFQSRIVDATNSLISAASVSVFKTGTSTLASLFSGEGLVPLANPFNSDHLGVFEFYVEGGDYDLDVKDPVTGFSRKFSDVSVFDVRNMAILKSGDSMQGQLLLASGSAASPGVGFVGDADTGFFRAGADQVGIATGGVQRVLVDSTQVALHSASVARMVGENRFRHLNSVVGVRALASQSLADGVFTVLLWDSEDFDTDNLHSLVTNTGRLHAVLSGKYLPVVSAGMAANATGFRALRIVKNGATVLGRADRLGNATDGNTLFLSALASLVSGDFVEADVFQNSGGVLFTDPNSATLHFYMAYLGE